MTRNMELSDRNHVRTTKRAKAKRRRVERWTYLSASKWPTCICFDGECVLGLVEGAAWNRAEDIVAALNRAGVTLPRGR